MTTLAKLWDHPNPHTLRTHVTAGDIDGLNHTNNAVYVKWCEQVAWAHSVALGLDLERYRALDRAMAITHSEYNYLQASREGEEVAVATWIVDWDKKLTMARRFQVIRIKDGVTLLRGGMRFACIEISSGRPRRLPKEFIEGYGPAVLSEQNRKVGPAGDEGLGM
jgi:acyl-CoA thioester hydrolase